MKRQILLVMGLALCLLAVPALVAAQSDGAGYAVRLKELARIENARGNALTGYGLVVGLAGTGDSRRSEATLRSVANTLKNFGVVVTPDQVNSRNVAAVLVTGELPPFASTGQELDVNVASLGDARSLVGGTLLLAPLKGPDNQIYALAQGPISVGGFKYDMSGNVIQKNHPTVGQIPGGAVVERSVPVDMLREGKYIDLALRSPDFTTASRIADSINETLGEYRAEPVHAGRVAVMVTPADRAQLVSFLRSLEQIPVVPDQTARVVVNERTGTVVAGGGVRLSAVTVSQGELRVEIKTEYQVSQPTVLANRSNVNTPNISTVVVPDTRISVSESGAQALEMQAGATVADLVGALRQLNATTRDMITVLQAIKRAGGLHAELIIQ